MTANKKGTPPPRGYFLKLAKSRKTTYEFTDKEIKNSDIKKFLEAARWAPSCSNSQPWRFIIIKNKETIDKLIRISSYGGFHTDPALIIALVLDFECWETSDHRCVRNSKVGTIESYLSIAMPALSMVFEAQEIGISTCLLTPEMNAASDILKLGRKNSAPLIVGFGYEKKGAFQKKRERKNLNEMVFSEYFGKKGNRGKIRY